MFISFSFSNFKQAKHLISAFTQLFRLTLAVFAALTGCITIYALNPTTNIKSYLLTAIILICMNAASFAINDYWDVDKDKINHPERPLPSGSLSPQQAWWSAAILFAVAIITSMALGFSAFILVSFSSLLLWNYSHLLTYSGVLGNVIVAANVASIILLGSIVAKKPLAMLYPLGFLFCYILAKEIVWDIHDAEGDRQLSVMTIANTWGVKTALRIAWLLLVILAISIPIAVIFLPMNNAFIFALFSYLMLLTFCLALRRYQENPNQQTYRGLSRWGRFGMLLALISLLAVAPPR